MSDIPVNYFEVIDFLSNQFDEVGGFDFYREIFPHNECSGEYCDDFSKPNAIYLYTDERDIDTKRRMRRRIMLNDIWEQDYIAYVERNAGTLCGGLTYRSRSNKLRNAQNCNALIIDLDGVGFKDMRNLFLRFGKRADMLRTLPMPTYIVVSGKGIHVYYVFNEPIPLFPNIKVQLKGLKHDLTFRMWEYKSTSQFKNIQYQSINQGFRMVGSINSKYGCEVKAYRIGGKVDIEYLNEYVKSKVDLNKRFRPSKMTKSEAKIRFPEWYARVFDENGKKKVGEWGAKWDIKGKVNGNDPFALYHWWMRRADEVKGGHRYFFLMCMSIYASKCDVPKKKLKEDMLEVFEILKEVEHDNPMTLEDIESALEMYSKEYWNFKIDDISRLTDIHIEKNKRNYQKQEWQLEDMRTKKANMKRRGQAFKNPEGRPKGSNKAKIVEKWRKEHPTGKKIDCERDTGLSRPTVLKWWNYDHQAEQEHNELERLSHEVIFAESEVTVELLDAMAKKGIRHINVVPDEEYEAVMMEKWLSEMKGGKK